jgi:hypothetical protein
VAEGGAGKRNVLAVGCGVTIKQRDDVLEIGVQHIN